LTEPAQIEWPIANGKNSNANNAFYEFYEINALYAINEFYEFNAINEFYAVTEMVDGG
jgi:hypothetical protein